MHHILEFQMLLYCGAFEMKVNLKMITACPWKILKARDNTTASESYIAVRNHY